MINPIRRVWRYSKPIDPEYSNNQAKYKVLMWGHTTLVTKGSEVRTNLWRFPIVIQHMRGEYKCNTIALEEFYDLAKQLLSCFADVTIEHVFKGENDEVNQQAHHAFGYKRLKDETLKSTIKEYCIMEIGLVNPRQ